MARTCHVVETRILAFAKYTSKIFIFFVKIDPISIFWNICLPVLRKRLERTHQFILTVYVNECNQDTLINCSSDSCKATIRSSWWCRVSRCEDKARIWMLLHICQPTWSTLPLVKEGLERNTMTQKRQHLKRHVDVIEAKPIVTTVR